MRYYGAKLWHNIFLNFIDVNCIHVFKVPFKDTLLDMSLLKQRHNF